MPLQFRRRRGVGVAVVAGLLAASAATALTVDDIYREPHIEGTRPQREALSPDEAWVAYAWNAAGMDTPLDLWIVPATGGKPIALTAFERDARPDSLRRAAFAPAMDDSLLTGLPKYFDETTRTPRIDGLAWSPDASRIAFVARGDLYVTTRKPGTLERLTYTRDGESDPNWSPDGRWIAFLRGGAAWLCDPERGVHMQLTTAGGDSVVPMLVRWSPDGRRLALVTRDDRGRKDLVIPSYLGERVVAGSVKEGFPDMGIRIIDLASLATKSKNAPFATTDEMFRVVRAKLGAGKHPDVSAIAWAPDGTRLAASEVLPDMRTRNVHVVGADSGHVRTVYTEKDSAWIQESEWTIADDPVLEWAPDGRSLLFQSERSGYNHLVRLPVASEAEAASVRLTGPENLTQGAWEVGWARWLPDGKRILLLGNRAATSVRRLELLDVATGLLTPLGPEVGFSTHVQSGPRGRRALFRHSRFDVPADLWSVPVRNGAAATQLTHTVPEAFRKIAWTVPEIVTFPARDGVTLRGLLYKPADFDPRRKVPVVVFVHGAGSMQNVVDGWTIYAPNYKFHSVLTAKGYAVFEVDYRGSLGYGRDFRTGVHRWMGGKDYEDELAGVDYLRTLGWIDVSRIGIYGGSYGGFLALMGLFKSPETYACGAALRFVADWANYYRGNPWYCVQRLGHPDREPQAYYRSSPIHFAAGLDDPLLLLHGMRDDNVHFQDAAQLTERLIRLGKPFDLMMYPRESHGFTAPESWIDQYARIEAFFDQHLQPGRTAGGAGTAGVAAPR